MRRRTDAVCPKDCLKRSAIPNCHNVETCERWAAYVARREAVQEARRKFKAEEDDVTAIHVELSRKAAKEAKRHRC